VINPPKKTFVREELKAKTISPMIGAYKKKYTSKVATLMKGERL
jgi:hypothetical protein